MTQSKLPRSESGRFTFKSNEPRQVRSIRLTDRTWELLGELAQSRSITRADLIENLVETGVIGEDSLTLVQIARRQIMAELSAAMNAIEADPRITRKGSDSGAVRRTLSALFQAFAV